MLLSDVCDQTFRSPSPPMQQFKPSHGRACQVSEGQSSGLVSSFAISV